MNRLPFFARGAQGERDFRWRGGDVSRLEALADAVFALSLALRGGGWNFFAGIPYASLGSLHGIFGARLGRAVERLRPAVEPDGEGVA